MLEYAQLKEMAQRVGLVPSTRVTAFAEAVYAAAMVEAARRVPRVVVPADVRASKGTEILAERVAEFFKNNPNEWLTVKDIESKFSVSKTQAYRARTALLANGTVTKYTPPEGGAALKLAKQSRRK